MPSFVLTRYNGQLHHSIEYGHSSPRRRNERLGTEVARVEITQEMAALGISKLVEIAKRHG